MYVTPVPMNSFSLLAHSLWDELVIMSAIPVLVRVFHCDRNRCPDRKRRVITSPYEDMHQLKNSNVVGAFAVWQEQGRRLKL